MYRKVISCIERLYPHYHGEFTSYTAANRFLGAMIRPKMVAKIIRSTLATGSPIQNAWKDIEDIGSRQGFDMTQWKTRQMTGALCRAILSVCGFEKLDERAYFIGGNFKSSAKYRPTCDPIIELTELTILGSSAEETMNSEIEHILVETKVPKITREYAEGLKVEYVVIGKCSDDRSIYLGETSGVNPKDAIANCKDNFQHFLKDQDVETIELLEISGRDEFTIEKLGKTCVARRVTQVYDDSGPPVVVSNE